MGDGRKMQHTVGGAAQSHIYSQGVQERFLCHNVTGTDILFPQLHDLHACVLRKLDSLGVDSRNGSISRKAHAQRLSQTVHAVGGIHTGAGTAGGTNLCLELFYVLLSHGACRVGAHCLEHAGKTALLAVYMTCQHGAAADENGRHIDTGCCHQKSRHILVTVRHHNQGVELMSHSHTLGGIGNQVTGYQGVFHAHMPHGDAVADCDSRKYNRSTAAHGNAKLYGFYDFIQVHMSRYDLIIGTHDADQRLLHLFFCQAQRVKQTAVGRLLHTLFYCVTSHLFVLLL